MESKQEKRERIISKALPLLEQGHSVLEISKHITEISVATLSDKFDNFLNQSR